MQISQKDIDRFFKYVNKTETCWLWTGGKLGQYGCFWLNKSIKASRFSAIIHDLPNPLNKPYVLHSCDNPPCVNPSHLRYGTNQDNMNDKISRNRQHKGENNPAHKLIKYQVLEILSKYKT